MARKILIVDDDQDIITFLETLFKREGYDTVTASNGDEGLEVFKRENPDLVTLDLQMPKNTGTGFYRKLRRADKSSKVPIIVISGLSGRHLALPEPFAVFDKPIDKDVLMEKIREALS